MPSSPLPLSLRDRLEGAVGATPACLATTCSTPLSLPPAVPEMAAGAAKSFAAMLPSGAWQMDRMNRLVALRRDVAANVPGAAAGEKELIGEVVTQFLEYAYAMALAVWCKYKRIGGRHGLEDLRSEAVVGLMKAIEQWEPRSALVNYASRWIIWNCRAAATKFGACIKSSSRFEREARKLKLVEMRAIEAAGAAEPGEGDRRAMSPAAARRRTAEIGVEAAWTYARRMGWSAAKYHRLRAFAALRQSAPVSLDAEVARAGEDSGLRFEELIAGEDGRTQDAGDLEALNRVLRDILLTRLTPKERYIFILRQPVRILDPADVGDLIDRRGQRLDLNWQGFGTERRKLEDIGAELGVTKERARQLNARGLQIVRQALHERQIDRDILQKFVHDNR